MFTLLLVFATSPQMATGAVFESDLWPGEGIPVFESAATQLSLHELPSASSKVIRRLTVKPKQRLVFDETRYRTIKPGSVTVLVSTIIKGRMLGNLARLSKADYYSGKFPDTSVNVSAGDTFEYLQYRAEGTCFVRVADKIIDASLCPTRGRDFRLDVEPTLEWWIQITVNSKPAGWLLVTDTTVRVIDRKG